MNPELFLIWLVQRSLRVMGACSLPYEIAKEKQFTAMREFVVYLATQYPVSARSYLYRMGLVGIDARVFYDTSKPFNDEENALIDAFIARVMLFPERMAWVAYLWALRPDGFKDYKDLLQRIIFCATSMAPEDVWASVDRQTWVERHNFDWVMKILQPGWEPETEPDLPDF